MCDFPGWWDLRAKWCYFVTLFWVRRLLLGAWFDEGGGGLELFQFHWRDYGMDILGIKVKLIN